MNVLVANISVLHDGKETKYVIKGLDCGEIKEITATETNESVLKCLAAMTEVKRNGGIGKIIALVSNRVIEEKKEYLGTTRTAYEFYKKIALDLGIRNIVQIHIDKKDINYILNEICNNISSNDTVYIDGAGGLRTINNVIQLLTKILKYTGIKNPHTLYADVQNRPNCFISDTRNFDKMTDLADAFNEFMTSGKSSQLRDCLKNISNQNILTLVNLMCEFSDKIRLGNIDDIETTVTELNKAAIDVETENDSSSMESVIIRRFIPIIRDKFIGNNEKTDYCRLVNWCLENSLIQQAVTIFTEKIPVYLFDNGIIKLLYNDMFANYSEVRTKEKPMHWQTYALYTNILADVSEANQTLAEFRRCLRDNVKSQNGRVNALVKLINELQPMKHGKGELVNSIKKYYKDNRFVSKASFKNRLQNDNKVCLQWLGYDENEKKDKFQSVNYVFENNKFIDKNFTYNVSTQQIVAILYGYLYVKNIRNRINHASDAEMFTDEQKKALGKYGYDFSVFDLKTIKNNIFNALTAITNKKE